MLSNVRLAAVSCLLSFALFACSETAPSPDDATGGSAPTGGVSGSGALGGSPNGGTAGTVTGGTPSGGLGGTSGAGTAGSGAGLGGGGASGQAGTGGATTAGSGGSAGLGGSAGSGGLAGSSGAGAGGRGGSGGSAGAGGAAGGAGMAGSGGTAAYNPCPAAPAPCVILPFGDSITDGFATPGGYRIDLFRRTLNENKRITFVGSAQNGPTNVDMQPFPRNHQGHSGFTIEGSMGIAQFVPDAMNRNPNIVLLMIGTNDLNGNVNVSQAPTRLGNLIDAMFQRRADMLVVVAQIVPSRRDALNNTIMAYNGAIPGLVSTRAAAGRHIVSVDMYGAFTRDANYKTALLADDLHPTPAGYLRMAETWYAAIGGLLR